MRERAISTLTACRCSCFSNFCFTQILHGVVCKRLQYERAVNGGKEVFFSCVYGNKKYKLYNVNTVSWSNICGEFENSSSKENKKQLTLIM